MRRINKESKHEINIGGSYKVGVDEIVGLKAELRNAIKPLVAALKSEVYWMNEIPVESIEYKSRGGFIPHSHNHGGVEINLVIPKCEGYKFPALEFGECEGCNDDCTKCTRFDENSSGECVSENEGHLDARLRIIILFEGINENDELEFYVNVCGGNGDAPYFRIQHLGDLYNGEFKASTVGDVVKKSKRCVNAAIKSIFPKYSKRGAK